MTPGTESGELGRARPGVLRMRAVLQAAADALGGDLRGARVLDLGAAEGRYAVEFARHGAEVTAIEGRRTNVEKARLVKDAQALDRLELVQADVRDLSVDVHGRFDVVLCLGLLYHLDGEAAVRLVHAVADAARRVAVFGTQVAVAPSASFSVGGRTYWGRRVREFDPGADAEEQERLHRSALGNPESFWLTRASLFNLLSDAGFSSVAELQLPRFAKRVDDVTLIAFRGSPRALVSVAGAADLGPARWPERERFRPHPAQSWRGAVKRRLAPYLPAALKVRRRRDR